MRLTPFVVLQIEKNVDALSFVVFIRNLARIAGNTLRILKGGISEYIAPYQMCPLLEQLVKVGIRDRRKCWYAILQLHLRIPVATSREHLAETLSSKWLCLLITFWNSVTSVLWSQVHHQPSRFPRACESWFVHSHLADILWLGSLVSANHESAAVLPLPEWTWPRPVICNSNAKLIKTVICVWNDKLARIIN